MDEWTFTVRRWRERLLRWSGPLRCGAALDGWRCERLRAHRGEHACGLGTCAVVVWPRES